MNQKSLGRAGSKCWLGKRPVVRGVVMNPVDENPMAVVKGGPQLVEKERIVTWSGRSIYHYTHMGHTISIHKGPFAYLYNGSPGRS